MIWLETPTNPLMKVLDIEAISKIAHSHKDIIVVVDNTFITSYFQRPLELGADIVAYSVSKYLNGESTSAFEEFSNCVLMMAFQQVTVIS